MLKPGLYEQIISQSLSRELASVSDACKHVEKLDAAEAPQALAGYVAEAVRAALEAMPAGTEEQSVQRIALVNKVLDVLSQQREDLSEKSVDDRAEKLLQILQENDPSRITGMTAAKMPRPETPMAVSSLFTGAAHEPKMFTELQKEIASADANNTSSTAFKVKNDERTSSDLLLDMRIDILSDYSFMQSATDAYETVLAYAGAWTCGWKDNEYIIPERDKIDRRIVSETANGTYSTNASKGGGYGLIDSQEDTIEKWDEYITETSSLVDTDKDGIPDGWEIAKGLNPNDASDGAKYNLSAAYTNLEVYLNGLVENTFPASHSK